MKTLPFLFATFILLNSAYSDQLNEYGIFENGVPPTPEFDLIKKATAAVVRSDKLNEPNLLKVKELYRYCYSQPFEDQKIWGNCSATLISKDVVLTAGHCIHEQNDCKNLSIAFDFYNSENIDYIRSEKSQLYSCKKILYNSKPIPQEQLKDYALIQLSRPVLDRQPIELNSIQNDQRDIFAVGHPMGIAQKISKGFITAQDAAANLENKTAPFYKASLITPTGLSGAGVYDHNFKLFSLVVRGDAAYQSDDGKCIVPVDCTRESCPWAELQILEIDKIKKVLEKAN